MRPTPCCCRIYTPCSVAQDEEIVAVWDEPNLDEILAQLEWAYNHREALHTLGAEAGRSMEQLHLASDSQAIL